MADLAAIFGWGPADMAGLDPVELAAWRARARTRAEQGRQA